jgi:hypothetical protein
MKSGIPQDITEKTVRGYKRKDTIHDHRVTACFRHGTLVGQRIYNQEGIMVVETPMKDGLKHGPEYSWDDDGKLLLIEPYVRGNIHGTAKQYGRNGRVIGTYTIIHGTGFDIWRQEDEDNAVFVSEISSLQDGFPNGFEWRFASSKQDLWHECHWNMGMRHGIQRMWNSKGKLRRGYPKFYISDQAVSKLKYVRMTSTDESLPKFQVGDNLPFRKFPREVRRLMSA